MNEEENGKPKEELSEKIINSFIRKMLTEIVGETEE